MAFMYQVALFAWQRSRLSADRPQRVCGKTETTNYGIGISIFKEGASLADYQAAVAIAFAEDDSILVETFYQGRNIGSS